MRVHPVNCLVVMFFFFFNDTATTEIYTLSLHDALPIWANSPRRGCSAATVPRVRRRSAKPRRQRPRPAKLHPRARSSRVEARAIQRGVRQSARKMRLVIDLIRDCAVPEADAILRFSKKRAARQIHKVLKSAVANAQQAAQRGNTPLDAGDLPFTYAVVTLRPTWS